MKPGLSFVQRATSRQNPGWDRAIAIPPAPIWRHTSSMPSLPLSRTPAGEGDSSLSPPLSEPDEVRSHRRKPEGQREAPRRAELGTRAGAAAGIGTGTGIAQWPLGGPAWGGRRRLGWGAEGGLTGSLALAILAPTRAGQSEGQDEVRASLSTEPTKQARVAAQGYPPEPGLISRLTRTSCPRDTRGQPFQVPANQH